MNELSQLEKKKWMKTGGRELTEETDKEKKRENNKTKGKDRESF